MSLAILDRAIQVEETLIVADLHVGKAPSAGIEAPVGAGADQLDRLAELLDRCEPDELVLAGDVLHSFETIPRTVEDVLAGIRSRCAVRDVAVTVTPGNHDTLLDRIWDGASAPTYRVGTTLVCHGDRLPEDAAAAAAAATSGGGRDGSDDGTEFDAATVDRYVVGHDHPTIEIEGRRHPCVLVGEGVYEGADLVMVPAFNRLLRGVVVNDMRAEDFRSPLVTDAGALRPVVYDDGEPLWFPPLCDLRSEL